MKRIALVALLPVLIAASPRDPKSQGKQDTAVTANGIIESIAQGFRFPNATVQTTAAVRSGAVPSINAIGSVTTIIGAGTIGAGTAAGTITLTGNNLTGVTAGNGLTGGGSSGTPALAVSYGTPVAIGTSNQNGSAATLARSDHVHAHGDQAGGSLHAVATTSTAGFASASDKTKLDSTLAYSHTILVSSGSTAATNGALLVATLGAISGNTSTNTYLLKLEPGLYSVGNTVISMKSYVDIEGSGEGVTFITSTRGSTGATSGAAAIVGSANSELRRLTLTNTSSNVFGIAVYASGSPLTIRDATINSVAGSSDAYGVYVPSGGNVTIVRSNVNATMSGGNTNAVGVVAASGGDATIQRSRITAGGTPGASAWGIVTQHASSVVTVESSTVIASGSATGSNRGVYTNPGTVTIIQSTIQVSDAATRYAVVTSASASSIVNVMHSRLLAGVPSLNASQLSLSKGTGSTVQVGMSQIDSASVGTPKCVQVYDLDMDDLNNACPGPIV